MALKAHAETIRRGYIKACEAVIGRGGSIATGAPIDELASAIYNIPADNAITTVTDNSIARVKTVPANSTKYAYLAEFGGMTYRDEETDTLVNAKVTEIVSNGANIWDEQTELGYWNGVDGGATQASNQIRSKNYIAVLPSTTYMNSTSFKIDLRFYDKDKRYIADSNSYSGAANSSFTTPSNAYYLKINLRSSYGTNYNNDIMLNIGSTIAPYVPYRAPISYPIPAEIQALEGYGKGVNSDYYNYIEWRDGRAYFVQNTKRIVFNGTESWTRSTATGIMQASVALSKIALFPHGISNLYDFVKFYSPDTLPEFRLTNSGAQLYVETSLSDFADVDAWKSYLATRYASENPVIVEYVLAEPIETEITDLFTEDNFIEVEGGGSIEFVNEYGYAIPSKMVYQTLTQ